MAGPARRHGPAIVRQADACLFDEPLSNLDAKLRGQMRTEILRLQRRLGTTTVYVPRRPTPPTPPGAGKEGAGARGRQDARARSPATARRTASTAQSTSCEEV